MDPTSTIQTSSEMPRFPVSVFLTNSLNDPIRNRHAFSIDVSGATKLAQLQPGLLPLGLGPERMFLLVDEDGKQKDHPEQKKKYTQLARKKRLWWAPLEEGGRRGRFYAKVEQPTQPAKPAQSATAASAQATTSDDGGSIQQPTKWEPLAEEGDVATIIEDPSYKLFLTRRTALQPAPDDHP